MLAADLASLHIAFVPPYAVQNGDARRALGGTLGSKIDYRFRRFNLNTVSACLRLLILLCDKC